MANIPQPANTSVLTWDSRFAARHTEQFTKAQIFVDSECLRAMSKYTPFLNGKLEQAVTLGTRKGSGRLIYASPYARYQYYGRLMVSRITGSAWARMGESKVLTPKKLRYTKSAHPQAQSFWFEKMKSESRGRILAGARKIAGGA